MGRSMLLVPTKVTGLGGSPDPTAVPFRGGAKRVHVWKPGPVSKRGGDHLHTLGIDFHKIFFHPPFSFSPSSTLRLALSASPSCFLELADARRWRLLSTLSSAYNVRPDRTWIRRRAGSFLMDIFGYPRRLESDLWTTSVHRPRLFGSLARKLFSTWFVPCVRVSRCPEF